MGGENRFPRSILGRAFPEGFVAVMVEEPSAVARLRRALAPVGSDRDDVRVVPGALALEVDASHHPSLATTPGAPEEDAVSEEFVAGALLGDLLVGIRAGSSARAREIARVLLHEGVRNPWYFEDRSVRRLGEPAGSAA